jgi:hypothetical protein
MTTTIHFGAAKSEREVTLVVEQDPEEVMNALTAAGGKPFPLDKPDGSGRVYVQPATITYWGETPTYGSAGF